MIFRIGLAGLGLCIAPALARAQECGNLRAVLDVDNQGFAAVSWRMAPRRGVSITVRGRPVDLPPAGECTLLSEPRGQTEFSCQWSFAGQAEAGAGYDGVLARTRRCLGADGMPSGTIYPGADAWRLVQVNEQEIEREGGAETDIRLELAEYRAATPDGAAPAPLRYFVTLRVTRDED